MKKNGKEVKDRQFCDQRSFYLAIGFANVASGYELPLDVIAFRPYVVIDCCNTDSNEKTFIRIGFVHSRCVKS